MRPKGSGYKSQVRILNLFRETPTLRFKQIKERLNIDEHTLSRNLKVLTERKLLKKEYGYRGYSTTPEFHSLVTRARKLDFQRSMKEMMKQPPMTEEEVEEMYKDLLNGKTPAKDWEFIEPSSFEEEERLWHEYQPEISELLKKDLNLDRKLLFSWAHYLRKIRQLKSYGARERRVGPKTKKPSPFKPKYE